MYLILHTFNMLSDVRHLPTACMRPSIKIVCCSLYPYRHNLVEFTLRIFHTCELFARILHSVWRIRTNFWGPFFDIISSSGRSFSYGLGTLQHPSVRPTVIISPPRPLVRLFLNLVRMFPSVSSCASVKKNSGPSTSMATVGHLWCFLLSHLLRNYLTDSNETCLLCLPQCLNVQVQKKISVRRQMWPFGSRLGLSEISHWQACYRISSKTTGRIFF